MAFIKGRYSERSYTIGRRTEKEHTYTGERLDVETGLYYYRHRTYHSQLGRFASRDPVGYLDPRKSYSYVRGRPKTNCGGRPLTARSTASCSRVAPRLRFVPWPRCNHHPVRHRVKDHARGARWLHPHGATPAETRTGRSFLRKRPSCPSDQRRSPQFGPQAALRRFAGANNMPPTLTGATG